MVRRNPAVVYEVIDGGALLLSSDGREFLTLNAVGAVVWEHLEGASAEELVDVVRDRFPAVDHGQVRSDVHRFLAELDALDLVEQD